MPRSLAVAVLPLMLVPFVPHAIAGDGENLVTVATGELPIVLSAPHGGRRAIPNVPERQGGDDVRRFVDRADDGTDRLADALAEAIEERVGKRPYVVVARFHRKYVDANRPARDAYETPAAKPVYDAYHRALDRARADVIERWGRGVLIDLHGQAAEPRAIFRGTQNGETTKHLVNRFGRESLIGRSSVLGQLARQGVAVIPAVGTPDREHPAYDGGHIVQTYGSSNSGTLDAIQLELGRELRVPQRARVETADKLAIAITAFAKEYLPSEEQRVRRREPAD